MRLPSEFLRLRATQLPFQNAVLTCALTADYWHIVRLAILVSVILIFLGAYYLQVV